MPVTGMEQERPQEAQVLSQSVSTAYIEQQGNRTAVWGLWGKPTLCASQVDYVIIAF